MLRAPCRWPSARPPRRAACSTNVIALLHQLRHRRTGALLGLTLLAGGLIAGCSTGAATPATGVTSNSATLNAQGECDGTNSQNPCSWFWQYWADGNSSNLQATPTQGPWSASTNGLVALSQPVGALQPGTLYHYQFCGKGDNLTTNYCNGSWNGSITPAGTTVAGINNNQNFRTADPNASPPKVSTTDQGRAWSTAENESTSGTLFYRDGGQSAEFLFPPTNQETSLWLFGDSPLSDGTEIHGSTAATTVANPQNYSTNVNTGANTVPRLNEVQTSNYSTDGSWQFLDDPTNLICPSRLAQSRWPSGATYVPGSSWNVIITFTDVCTATNTVQQSGLREYDPVRNQFSSPYAIPFTSPSGASIPAQEHLSAPLFFNSDGYIYFFSSDCDATAFGSCTSGKVFVSRVRSNSTAWSNPGSYQWWSGGSWSSDPMQATSVLPSGTNVGPFAIGVSDFSNVAGSPTKFAMIEMTDIGGGFEILTSSSPVGPWTVSYAGRAPDNCAAPQGNTMFCRTFNLHPELSTAHQLVYSWFSVDDYDTRDTKNAFAAGHVRLASIPWGP